MGRNQLVAGSVRRHHSSINPWLSGKNLDLVVLAGCSCLLTLLYHPVIDAVWPTTSSEASLNPLNQIVMARANTVEETTSLANRLPQVKE